MRWAVRGLPRCRIDGSMTASTILSSVRTPLATALAGVAVGGMATIYAALDLRLDRQVAVKIMHPHLAQDEKFVERFISINNPAALTREVDNLITDFYVNKLGIKYNTVTVKGCENMEEKCLFCGLSKKIGTKFRWQSTFRLKILDVENEFTEVF